jgi:ferric iron reductase protein FhuF
MMVFDKGDKGFKMMGEYFKLCKKWEKLEEGKSEETLLDEAIADMVDFCRKYVEKNDRFAVNIAAVLFQRIDDGIRKEMVLGADKGSLRLSAMWLEKLLSMGGKQ